MKFSQVLGREQLSLEGKRTDLGVTSNSISRADIAEMDPVENVSFSDFLPHTVTKNNTRRERLGHSAEKQPFGYNNSYVSSQYSSVSGSAMLHQIPTKGQNKSSVTGTSFFPSKMSVSRPTKFYDAGANIAEPSR